MSWLRRHFGAGRPERSAGLDAGVADPGTAGVVDGDDVFVCTTCGRSDLPEAGG